MELLALLLSVLAGYSLPWMPDSSGRTQAELWLDPYYSAVNATRSLVEAPIPRLDTRAEGGVYWWLMRRLPFPRDVLVEASLNPLPVGGWALRKFDPGTWEAARVGEVNLVESVTRGFPEPWALSLFLGNVVNLVSQSDTTRVNGVGYSGLLVSWGAWHLVENRMVRDDWFESEIKLKGDDIQSRRKLTWSYRLGWREHLHPGIHDALYLSISRRRTDFDASGLDPFRNASIEGRIDFDRADLPRPSPLRMSLLLGKKFPVPSGAWAFSLSAGVLHEARTGYDGDLAHAAPRRWTLLLRPNVEW
ncbi:MAG: hypothetical protein H6686_03175 [Fibrobacteria bacterium]|nr:hypothetical protein [Fibrobacteria bacterium]